MQWDRARKLRFYKSTQRLEQDRALELEQWGGRRCTLQNFYPTSASLAVDRNSLRPGTTADQLLCGTKRGLGDALAPFNGRLFFV